MKRTAGRITLFLAIAVGAGFLYSFALRLTAVVPGVARTVVMAGFTFAVLASIFATFERIAPEKQPAVRGFRGERLTDICWWFLGYASRFAAEIGTTVCIVVVVRMLPNHPEAIINTQPIWLQVIEALLIGDFFQYWIHRFLHKPLLWSIHAIHHSPEELNWLSTTRIHPMETILKGPVEMVPLYFLGFSTVATLPLVTITLGLYEIFVHANVGWRFGPLRFVIASPAFHRWHHTAETEGFDKDFAGMFPFYDLAFGTFYLPDRASTAYGLGNGRQMLGFWEQMANPIRFIRRPQGFSLMPGEAKLDTI